MNSDAERFRPLLDHIEDFLVDLGNANKPANTIRAYRGDLLAFAEYYDGDLEVMDVVSVRQFLTDIAHQAPATRKRKRAAVSAFCRCDPGSAGRERGPWDRCCRSSSRRTFLTGSHAPRQAHRQHGRTTALDLLAGPRRTGSLAVRWAAWAPGGYGERRARPAACPQSSYEHRQSGQFEPTCGDAVRPCGIH